MTAPLRILAPTRYPWRFNSPRNSRHIVEIRGFVPFNYLSPKIEGITVFNPWPPKRFDLVHAFNRIPIGTRPFIIGFESHLPRAFGMEEGRYWSWLRGQLLSPRCRGIFAISDVARRIFAHQHRDLPEWPVLRRKLHLRYPNLPIPGTVPDADLPTDRLRVTFVGNHFARKGGCVAVRLAEMARQAGLPLEVVIISKMEMGGAIWTDPPDAAFYEPYLRAMRDLPNVVHHPGLPNRDTVDILRRSHFSLLATFSDTFGYSAIESLAWGTPVIATTQGALPEFIRDGESGLLLDLPVNALGEWLPMAQGTDRASAAFQATYRDEIERMAQQTLDRLAVLFATPGALDAMRPRSHAVAKAMFSAGDANGFWDDLYERAVQAPVENAA